MRVLLDENLPHALRMHLAGHDVFTTAYQGWASWSNGARVKAADDAGFDVLLTADQGLNYQQNLAGRGIAIVVISTNRYSLVLANTDKIATAIKSVSPGGFSFIEIG